MFSLHCINVQVKASERSGASTEDVHVPKLWYYDLLLFLEDQDTPRTSRNAESLLDEMPFGMDDEVFNKNKEN